MQPTLAKNMIRSLGLMMLVVMTHADLVEECQSKQSPLPHDQGTCAEDVASMLQSRMKLEEANLTYDPVGKEQEVQMVEGAALRDSGGKAYCQLYAVPVNFWRRYTKYKGREPKLKKSKMRQYFATWGSDGGKQPHVTMTRDWKFKGGDTKARCRKAAQNTMRKFWKRWGSQKKNFRLDKKKLKCGWSPSKKANKLKLKTGGRHKLLDSLEKFFRKKKWPETPLPLHATYISCTKSPSYKAMVKESDWRIVANFKVSGGKREWLWLGEPGKL